MLVEIAFTVDDVEHFEIAQTELALDIVGQCQVGEIDAVRGTASLRIRRKRRRR